MITNFSQFLNEGKREQDKINQLLDKGVARLSREEKALLDRLVRGGILEQPKPTKPTNPKVTVYSTPSCGYCVQLKDWLRKNKIEFTDIDVSRNQEAARYIIGKSGQRGVPQTEIKGEVVVGFDPDRIMELIRGY
jgi:glutaredoxin-like YruB-family protein